MSFFNDGKRIELVMERVACQTHGALQLEPCWSVFLHSTPYFSKSAVCGQRILAAGYNGVISPFSLRKTSEGPFGGRSKRYKKESS